MASVLATISDTLSIAVPSLVLMWSQLILLNISFKSEKETKTSLESLLQLPRDAFLTNYSWNIARIFSTILSVLAFMASTVHAVLSATSAFRLRPFR